ncbi:MAG: hypothetical protein QOC62_4631 [Mycobacterium sp.]|nr:hypothetical protein [Mycobacterium sp.]
MRKKLGPDAEIADTDLGFLLKHSGEYEVIGDFWMPLWVEWRTTGYDGPDLLARMEVRNSKPELVRLEWSSIQDYKREIRQRDLRAMEVSGLVEVLYAGLTFHADSRTGALERGTGATEEGDNPPAFYAAKRFIERQRRPEGYRKITPDFLQLVADVYLRNIDGAPTQAVAKAFGVKPRMASVYVERAEKLGLLPTTTQGKKRAK